jgi:hypothetical protein
MAKIDDIKDDELRGQLEAAHAELRGRKPTEAVQLLCDAFIAMLTKNPRILQETVPVRGRRMPLVMRWPALGANLSLESVRAGNPKIEFVRDKFAMSEALTYYEFTVDTAIAQGL